jgi:hypothetical protein
MNSTLDQTTSATAIFATVISVTVMRRFDGFSQEHAKSRFGLREWFARPQNA